MIILAIDTSTDETSVAILNGQKILCNVISSQVRYHKKFGGVVPFLAQRLHKERIDSVISEALSRAQTDFSGIDAIAVTYGPGLAPALQVGVEKAKLLAVEHGLPLYAVNHMMGHISSCFSKNVAKFPMLAVLVSGGHSELVYTRSFGEYQIIGQTLDDSLGEAYDKVARMLGLGYPGGKLVAKLALEGDSAAYALPVPMLRSGDLNLSYSGLKNAVRLLIGEVSAEGPLSRKNIADICACFEYVAQESLLRKVTLALSMYPEVQQVALAGGVSANVRLRAHLRAILKKHDLELVVPANQKLCTDNAAMIGLAAHFGILAGQKPAEIETLDRIPYLSLEDVHFSE